jgi:hypothetical protein
MPKQCAHHETGSLDEPELTKYYLPSSSQALYDVWIFPVFRATGGPLANLHTLKRVFTIATNKTYPNRLLVINPSANGSPYNIPQSSQGSSPASVSNPGNVICPRPMDPLHRLIDEPNTGVVARWNGQSYNKTTVTSGTSYTKVETYSKWVRFPLS